MRLTPEDEIGLRRISGLTISPDGAAVVFVVDEADPASNRRSSRLWLNTSDGAATLFTSAGGSQRLPAWSPSGELIAYVTNGPGDFGRDRLMVVPAAGGPARLLLGPESGFIASGFARRPGGGATFAWSPDSRRIACLLRVGESIPGDLAVDGPRALGDPQVITEISERLRGGPAVRLGVVDVESGVMVELGGDERPFSSICWAPDGTAVYAVSHRHGGVNPGHFRLLRYAIDQPAADPVCLTEFSGASFAPCLSPDGTRFVVSAARGSSHAPGPCLLLLSADSGEIVAEISADDRTTFFELAWSPAGDAIFALADRGVRRQLVRIDPASGAVSSLTGDERWIEMARLSGDGSTVAFVSSSLDDPGDLYFLASGGGEPRRATRLNRSLAGIELARGRAFDWTAPDGTTIEGILLLPPGLAEGERLPLIIDFHGGPASHVTLGWNGARQVFAAAGYAVFAPNFRGSTGYGAAFTEALRGDLGGVTLSDSLAGISHLIEEGVVDPDRQFAYGHSWGGFMTNWAVTHTDQFRAAVSSGSICDLVSVYHTRYSADVWEWRLLGRPQDSAALERYRQWSAILYADRVTTPVLFLNGSEDRTTPPTQGLEMFTALRKRDVPAEYVVYPREGHGIVEPVHHVDRLGRILTWFAQHDS